MSLEENSVIQYKFNLINLKKKKEQQEESNQLLYVKIPDFHQKNYIQTKSIQFLRNSSCDTQKFFDKFQLPNNNQPKLPPNHNYQHFQTLEVQTLSSLIKSSNEAKSEQKTYNQNEMVLLDPIMLRDFKNRGYDVIDIRNNSDYVKLMIQINIIFYLSSNQSNINNIIKSADYQHQVRGKLYSSFFDSNKNPKYITQEGEFFVDLKNNLFQLNGQGIKYSGKSNNVNEKGEYNKGIKIQTRKSQNKIERKSQSIEPKTIKIFEVLNGKLILRNQKKILSTWCKYNQQISLNDLKILRTQGWLTSSIIDSYVLSLNLESQKKYFALNYKERQHIKKIFLVPTSLVTNIGGNYNMTQAIELFQSHFLELQEIKFEFQIMYTKIGFPINSNNVHWYFLLFDLEKNEVEIYDSLSPKPYSQILDLKIISELLMLKSPKISFNKNNYEQKDSYSCGYHVCHFMKFCHEKQFQKDLDYQYDENQMRLILKQVIEDEEN